MTQDAAVHWKLRWQAPATPLLVPTPRSIYTVYAYASAQKPYVYVTLRPGSASSISAPIMQRRPPIDSQPAILDVDPTNPDRLYAAYSFPLRVYESSNGALSWKQIL